jgi:hypothetical protein
MDLTILHILFAQRAREHGLEELYRREELVNYSMFFFISSCALFGEAFSLTCDIFSFLLMVVIFLYTSKPIL